MCTTCGCGSGETKIEGEAPGHEHRHADGTVQATRAEAMASEEHFAGQTTEA